jgi:dynein heavy chain
VQAARQEATENVRFLEPLRKLLEKLNTMDDFVALSDHFKPLLHSMLLIWKLSSSYSSSARFATLLREICNGLIMQVRASRHPIMLRCDSCVQGLRRPLVCDFLQGN